MSGKYKIKISDKQHAIRVIEILIKANYLFFQKYRYNTVDKVVGHIRRNDCSDYDGLNYVRWILTGYTDCNRLFGASDELLEDDEIFGNTSLYKVVTVEEFLQETKGTPCQQ